MRLIDALADLVIGAQCPGCCHVGLGLCATCRDHLTGEPLTRQLDHLRVWSAVSYQPPVPGLVKHFKDGQAWGLAKPLSEALAAALAADVPPDTVLVPVPSPAARVRARGFDHTSVLAAELGRRRRLPVRALLRPPRGRRDQRELGRDQRWANQQSAFTARVGDEQVVVVDDVVTTGATLSAACQALSQAGHRVWGAVTVASAELRIAGLDPNPRTPDSPRWSG